MTSVALDGDGPGQSSDRAGGGADRRPARAAGAAGRRSDPGAPAHRGQSGGRPDAGPRAGAPAAATEPVELGGMTLATNAEGAAALKYWCLELEAESKALAEGGIPAPVSVETTRAAGLKHAQTLRRRLAADPLQRRRCCARGTRTSSRRRTPRGPRRRPRRRTRSRRAADKLKAAHAKLASARARAARRPAGAASATATRTACWQTADAIANVLDTGLVAKETIDQLTIVRGRAAAHRRPGHEGRPVPAGPQRATSAARSTCSSGSTRSTRSSSSCSAGIDLLTEGKTANAKGHKGVAAMGTLVSAGGTLLNASAGLLALRQPLHRPDDRGAASRCSAKLEDLISKGSNRDYIQAGRPEMVNWSLEPGGRRDVRLHDGR